MTTAPGLAVRFRFPCKECPFGSMTCSELLQHMNLIHADPTKKIEMWDDDQDDAGMFLYSSWYQTSVKEEKLAGGSSIKIEVSQADINRLSADVQQPKTESTFGLAVQQHQQLKMITSVKLSDVFYRPKASAETVKLRTRSVAYQKQNEIVEVSARNKRKRGSGAIHNDSKRDSSTWEKMQDAGSKQCSYKTNVSTDRGVSWFVNKKVGSHLIVKRILPSKLRIHVTKIENVNNLATVTMPQAQVFVPTISATELSDSIMTETELSDPIINKIEVSDPIISEIEVSDPILTEVTAPTLFHCKQCPFSCNTSTDLTAHCVGHVAKRSCICPFCNYSADVEIDLEQHVGCHFSMKSITVDKCRQIVMCALEQLKRKLTVKSAHMGNSFSQSVQAGSSINQSLTSSSCSGSCQYCGRSFITNSDLTRHEAKHESVNNFIFAK